MRMAQAPQFLVLVSREPVTALALVQISVLELEPQRLARHAQLTCNLGVRLPARSCQSDRLSAKLRRIGWHMFRHEEHLLRGFTPRCTGVHQSGATSACVEHALSVCARPICSICSRQSPPISYGWCSGSKGGSLPRRALHVSPPWLRNREFANSIEFGIRFVAVAEFIGVCAIVATQMPSLGHFGTANVHFQTPSIGAKPGEKHV